MYHFQSHFGNYFQDKHLPIIDYFITNGFGTNMPVLTYFSTLKPIDRCVILEALFILEVRNIRLFDKMVLAYVKVGRPDLAEKVVAFARQMGVGDSNCWELEQKLDLGVPLRRTDEERQEMFENYLAQTNNPSEINFLNLLTKFISDNIPSEPTLDDLTKKANSQFELLEVTKGRQILFEIYRTVKSDPSQLLNVNDYSAIGASFLLMISQKLYDDIDTLQMIASVGYFFTSKAIAQEQNNIKLYSDRLMFLRNGQESLILSVMDALDFNSNKGIDFARDAIYRMEIADLELNPLLSEQFLLHKVRKIEFEGKIEGQYFTPDNTIEKVVKSGVENHKRLFDYLENKIIDKEDLDFSE